jgi:hypothetical protein
MSELGRHRTYNSAEVCAAAGVPRVTFNAWLLRKYLPLPPGPGTGRSRQYSMLDAVRIAVVADLNRLGINVGVAAKLSGLVAEPLLDKRKFLVLAPSTQPLGDEAVRAPPATIVHSVSLSGVEEKVALSFSDPASLVTVDISAVARRVASRLGVPVATGSATEDASTVSERGHRAKKSPSQKVRSI